MNHFKDNDLGIKNPNDLIRRGDIIELLERYATDPLCTIEKREAIEQFRDIVMTFDFKVELGI